MKFHRYKYLVLAFIALPILFLAQPVSSQDSTEQNETFIGHVVGVSDGDTILVMRFHEPVKIRLAEIDCPEKKQAFGQRAKTFTSNLAFGKTVTVKMRTVDRYGRIVAEIILPDGKNLNRELVKAGLAWWYHRYSDDESYGELEQNARTNKRGLWSDPHAIPPWEFRHQ